MIKASVQTWIDQVESGNVKHNTAKVLNYIKRNTERNNDLFSQLVGVTITEVKNDLRLLHPTATSCITNLADAGLIKEIGQAKETYTQNDKERTTTYTLYTYVYDRNERKELARLRAFNKFTDWLDRGINEFNDYLTEDDLATLVDIRQATKDVKKDFKELNALYKD
jgi:Fic family protein